MVENGNLGDASIIIAEYISKRWYFSYETMVLNLEIEGDYKIVIDCFNKKK